MAEVKWTGPLVRKTFLDFFAERGHSIGKTPPPLNTPRWRLCVRPWQLVQKNTDSFGIIVCKAKAIIMRIALP